MLYWSCPDFFMTNATISDFERCEKERTTMLQDIAPHVFHGEYRQIPPRPQDSVIAGRGRALLLRAPLPGSDPAQSSFRTVSDSEQSPFPTISDLEQLGIRAQEPAFYLFSVDDERYFFLDTAPDDALSERWEEDALLNGTFRFQDVMKLRELEHSSYAFAGAVGHQLFSWYAENRYCGACGSRTEHSETERALCCPKC
jgi:NAD+ diphosphatase